MVLAVEEKLRDAGVEYRLIKLADRAVSVGDVIEFSLGDIDPSQITKTILVKSKKGFIGLFLRGADRVSFSKLKQVMGKASIAKLEDVRRITGVDPGAVCPLLIDVPIILDEKVRDLEKINFGSGDHLYGVEMKTSDLEKVLKYQVEDISD